MKHASPRHRGAWLEHPVLSALLAAVWLLLQQSVSLPNLLAAAAIGVLVPRGIDALLGPSGHPRRPGVAMRFVLLVLWDIVVANVAVARLVLSPTREPRPAWVPVPFELQDPTAVTLLAAVITTTPGTISCVIDETQRVIYVHALDCDDPAAMAADIQQRYENPLKEIFEWHRD